MLKRQSTPPQGIGDEGAPLASTWSRHALPRSRSAGAAHAPSPSPPDALGAYRHELDPRAPASATPARLACWRSAAGICSSNSSVTARECFSLRCCAKSASDPVAARFFVERRPADRAGTEHLLQLADLRHLVEELVFRPAPPLPFAGDPSLSQGLAGLAWPNDAVAVRTLDRLAIVNRPARQRLPAPRMDRQVSGTSDPSPFHSSLPSCPSSPPSCGRSIPVAAFPVSGLKPHLPRGQRDPQPVIAIALLAGSSAPSLVAYG